jgi:hypothetical protein
VKVNGYHLFTLLGMAVAVMGIALPVSIGAAGPQVQGEVGGEPSRGLRPPEAATLANDGTRVLLQIADARGAIWEKDASRAREVLRNAESLLNGMRSSLPTAIVRDRIWVARKHLEYEETSQVLPDLVPIDQELVLLGDFLPTTKARSHLEKARRLLETGDKQAGLEELKAVNAAVVYEEVDLPISETEAHLSRALGELAIGDTGNADSALRAAEASVQSIVAVARGPRARGSPTADTRANRHAEGK